MDFIAVVLLYILAIIFILGLPTVGIVILWKVLIDDL